jgi:RNA polymerase sigma factor (sigma-70 family)
VIARRAWFEQNLNLLENLECSAFCPDTPRVKETPLDLTTFINAYRGPLIGLIVSWGAPWADATEIAQDSFSEAWLNRDACLGDRNDLEFLGRWLRGVALNQYRNWFRSRQRRNARIVTLSPSILEQTAVEADHASPEYLEALRWGIERLAAVQREVVLMHYLEETSVKQVATLLSVSVKTVEGRLFQARTNLRRILGDGFPTV